MYSTKTGWSCRSCGYRKEAKNESEQESKNKSRLESKQESEEDNYRFAEFSREKGSEVSQPSKTKELKALSADPDINDLREQAKEAAIEEVPESIITSSQSKPQYARSQEVRDYVLARAKGICEGCGEPAPFISKTGKPYLHAHHIHELSDGGSDTPDTVIALCPNCHYHVHHGEGGDQYNQELFETVQEKE